MTKKKVNTEDDNKNTSEKSNSVVESITIEDDEDDERKDVNTFQDSIKELGSQIFTKNLKKTSNLSHDNINGLIRAETLNEYMESSFGYRHYVLDKLINEKQIREVSHKGFGIEKLIEIVKSIQASFEQTQLPSRMRDLIGR